MMPKQIVEAFRTASYEVKQYILVTLNYWAFTLTDGALRMLVVLYFHQLGYAPLEIAFLFLFYEAFGVLTNLFGGWLGARIGLNRTMNLGLGLQILALGLLLVPTTWLTVLWVMVAQALSGIAKDLNKMSAKSAIKVLIPKDDQNMQSTLYRWVALLTGSKNALKGVGFFLGGVLLTLLDFQGAILSLMLLLLVVWLFSLWKLGADMGKAKNKPKFSDVFSKSAAVNLLSAARMFLFGARDVWFVVALPVFLAYEFAWDHWQVGSFLAIWVIFYGMVQALAPKITRRKSHQHPDGRDALYWAMGLMLIPALMSLALMDATWMASSWTIKTVVVGGLLVFGAVFAVNSSLHSYLIVSYAKEEGVSMDVGFYYMANAMGRLIGTLLSGYVYQAYGLTACLLISSAFILVCVMLSFFLPRQTDHSAD